MLFQREALIIVQDLADRKGVLNSSGARFQVRPSCANRQRHDQNERDGNRQSFLLHVMFSSLKFCSKLPMSNSTVPGAASNH